jgi:hypothetical protein
MRAGNKTHWAVQEVDYLGFRLTPEGVRPQLKKVDAIRNIAAPTTKRQLRHFVGLVNYYRYMWKRRSHLIAPLTELMSKNVPFKWTEKHEKAFKELKDRISAEVCYDS